MRPQVPMSMCAAIAAALLLAGCGSDGGTAGTPPGWEPTRSPSRPAASLAAYRQCLADHGATPPPRRIRTAAPDGPASTAAPAERPSRDPAEVAAFREAHAACAALRPPGGLRADGLHPGARAGFYRCLRQRGVVLPRPERSAAPSPGAEPGTDRGGMLAGLDRNDPVVAKALAACRELVIANTPDSSAPTPTSG